jgi:hypothetical protein
MATAGSYMMIARDNNEALAVRINAVEREISGLQADVRWLAKQERDETGRER